MLARGIDGRGETVVLPELAEPQFPLPTRDIRADLAEFDKLFHLPSAHLRLASVGWSRPRTRDAISPGPSPPNAFFAQFVPEADRNPEQAAALAVSTQLIDEVLAADTVLIGLPLYNFAPPSTFKAGFDRIVSERTRGNLTDKQFVIVTARGGGYGPGTPREGWDHGEPWLRQALSSIGVDNANFISAEFTLARESPNMIPLDLGAAEDKSLSDAFAAIDRLFVADKLSVS